MYKRWQKCVMCNLACKILLLKHLGDFLRNIWIWKVWLLWPLGSHCMGLNIWEHEPETLNHHLLTICDTVGEHTRFGATFATFQMLLSSQRRLCLSIYPAKTIPGYNLYLVQHNRKSWALKRMPWIVTYCETFTQLQSS